MLWPQNIDADWLILKIYRNIYFMHECQNFQNLLSVHVLAGTVGPSVCLGRINVCKAAVRDGFAALLIVHHLAQRSRQQIGHTKSLKWSLCNLPFNLPYGEDPFPLVHSGRLSVLSSYHSLLLLLLLL